KANKTMLSTGMGFSSESAVELPFLTITPRNIIVMMDETLMVTLNYTIPCHNRQDSYSIQAMSGDTELFVLKGNTTFTISCGDAQHIDIAIKGQTNSDFNETGKYNTVNSTKIAARGSVQLNLHGILLGITKLEVKLKHIGSSLTTGTNSTDVNENSNSRNVIDRSFNVDVLRVLRPIDEAFKVIVGCFISIVIMGFGCGLDLEAVKECLKKPIAPGIGLGCQYVLMPLVCILLIYIFRLFVCSSFL
ncbi:MAG: hypothetical protein AB2693_27995, partial [Candidatus Thiodiazotropha sp.]